MNLNSRCEMADCREPAHWRVTERGGPGRFDFGGTEYEVCERHAIEALQYTHDEVCGLIDGEPVRIDEELGELVAA